jgi:hypothetical protein
MTHEWARFLFAVCQISYAQTFLLNTVFLPACLIGLVVVTWATTKEDKQKRGDDEKDDDDDDGYDEAKIAVSSHAILQVLVMYGPLV